jgi:hypothetical protein
MLVRTGARRWDGGQHRVPIIAMQLVDDASIDGKVSAFTTRGRRRAYVIPPALYDELLRLRAESAAK